MQQTPLHCIKPSSASTTISNYWFLVSLPASIFAAFLSCVPSRKQRTVDNGRPNQIIAHVPWMSKEARRPQLGPPTTMRARRSGAKSITVWRIIAILLSFESSADTLDVVACIYCRRSVSHLSCVLTFLFAPNATQHVRLV